MDRPAPDDEAAERTRARQWRLAQVNVAVAAAMLALGLGWWFVPAATWQPPTFTVIGVLLTAGAVSNVRQLRRNRLRRGEARE